MVAQDSSEKAAYPRYGLRAISVLFAMALGALLSEGGLRVLMPPPIFYSTWFTEGVHQRDQELGFVFRPGWEGAMRHSDHVWMQPLRLDSNGFRPSAIRTDAIHQKAPLRIAILGGASMAFCYGLPEKDCLHQQLADRLGFPCQIELLSWPGFSIRQDVLKFERFCDPNQYDLVIVCAYGYNDLLPRTDWRPDPPPAEIPMIDSVVVPQDPAAQLVGETYYRSYLVAGFCRVLESPIRIWRNRFGQAASARSTGDSSTSKTDELLVDQVAQHIRDLGVASVLVVALPRQGELIGPAELPAVRGDWKRLDLRREFDSDPAGWDWIASGHYGRRAAGHLADCISKELSSASE